jgi:CHAT domain-containing protein
MKISKIFIVFIVLGFVLVNTWHFVKAENLIYSPQNLILANHGGQNNTGENNNGGQNNLGEDTHGNNGNSGGNDNGNSGVNSETPTTNNSETTSGYTGNQSDITGPDTQEFMNNNNSAETPTNTDISGNVAVEREQFESQFLSSTPDQAVEQFEEAQTVEFSQYLGMQFYGQVASSQQISKNLGELSAATGENSGMLYVVSLKDQIQVLFIPPELPQDNNKNLGKIAQTSPNTPGQILRQIVPDASRTTLQQVVNDFRAKITNPRQSKSYLVPAKKLYDWLIAPVEPALKANKIKNLILSMDRGLRALPVSALHDGKQFLIEKYAIAIVPNYSLTDSRYIPISKTQMLAMGISKNVAGQVPLPLAEVEVETLVTKLWKGQKYLNEKFTLQNFKSVNLQQRYGIIHLATHGEFKGGTISNSYIQFWDRKLRLNEISKLSQELKWNSYPKIEMLVLSSCRTALGNDQAELGFAGLAVKSGVKTALGSLWYVSDEGAMALMTKFYEQLKMSSFRADALRKAQIAMIKGEVKFEKGKLRLSPKIQLSIPGNITTASYNLSHPYFWSGFVMIGNWN